MLIAFIFSFVRMKFCLVLFAIIGLTVAAPTRSLETDLQEIAALIPIEDIKAIVVDYNGKDADVQRIVAYLQSDKWAELVATVAANPQYKELKQVLIDAGLPIDAIVQRIHDFIASLKPANGKQTRTLRDMVDEIEAIIPMADLIAVLNDKLQNSQDFIDFYLKCAAPETKALVEEVHALPEVQRLEEELKGYGMDLDAALSAIYDFFGWDQ